MTRIHIRRSETDKGKPILFDLTAYLNGQVSGLPKLVAGAVIMVPIILAYTAWAYWVFRGKVGNDGYH